MNIQHIDTGTLIAPQMIIAGEVRRTAATRPVLNPARELEIGLMPCATAEDVDAAVEAARQAFRKWKTTPLEERARLVAAIGERIAAHVEELALILTAEQGKPLADARAEIAGTATWLAQIARQEIPVEILEDSAERRIERRHVPLGVVAAISPWNFPIKLGYWKVGPALLTGNCVILKPSPFTPLSTLRIMELVQDLVPAGVFCVLTGDDDLGPMLTEHAGIDKVTFTGSSATGSKVMRSAAGTLKRVTLELGGNDPAVVLPDVDVEDTATKIFWSALRNNGQVCIATKRIYVHEAIYEAFRDAFVALARSVRTGDGMEEGVQLGPVQNRLQFERVQGLIQDCRDRNYQFLTGDDGAQRWNRGYFVPVTIIDNPPDESRIVREEPFGPVVPLLKFSDVDEVIDRVNDTPYGLGGSVWTRDIALGQAIAERIESGMVWVNESQYITPVTPFGGRKQSGIGAEAGIEGLLEYTAGQTVVVRKA